MSEYFNDFELFPVLNMKEKNRLGEIFDIKSILTDLNDKTSDKIIQMKYKFTCRPLDTHKQ